MTCKIGKFGPLNGRDETIHVITNTPDEFKVKTTFISILAGIILVCGHTGLATAQLWNQTGVPWVPWRTVACSADGKKLVAKGYNVPDGMFLNVHFHVERRWIDLDPDHRAIRCLDLRRFSSRRDKGGSSSCQGFQRLVRRAGEHLHVPRFSENMVAHQRSECILDLVTFPSIEFKSETYTVI
jgi:hypothetical protein